MNFTQKTNFKTILLVLIISVLSFLPILSADATAEELGTEEYYGRTALMELPDSSTLLYVYDTIADATGNINIWENIDTGCRVFINLTDKNVTWEQFEIALNAYINDYPQHFWLKSEYSVAHDAHIINLRFYCEMSKENLLATIDEFERAVEKFLEDIPKSLDEYETEKAIHDKLINHITYDKSNINAHNAYGAIVEGKAVCAGYAEAFQYLLYKRGIQAHRVVGMTHTNEYHGWTLVRIDGNYYYTDVTWDDTNYDKTSYACFNVTTEQLNETRTLSETVYKLPECTATEANYFVKEGLVISQPYNVQEIASLFKSSLVISVYIEDLDSIATFSAWVTDNIREIAKEVGVKNPCSYRKHQYQHEFYLTFIEKEPTSDTSKDESFSDNSNNSCLDASESSQPEDDPTISIENTDDLSNAEGVETSVFFENPVVSTPEHPQTSETTDNSATLTSDDVTTSTSPQNTYTDDSRTVQDENAQENSMHTVSDGVPISINANKTNKNMLLISIVIGIVIGVLAVIIKKRHKT